MDTGTLGNIADVLLDGKRWLFLTADGKFITHEEGKVKITNLPGGYQPEIVRKLQSGEYLVVDNRMRLLLSSDKGTSWQVFENALQTEASSDFAYLETDKGFYVYSPSKGVPKAIVYVDSGVKAVMPVRPPSSAGILGRRSNSKLIARGADLFLLYDTQDFDVRLAGKPDWVSRSKPEATCGGVEFSDDRVTLKTMCGNTVFESSDNGLTWSKQAI